MLEYPLGFAGAVAGYFMAILLPWAGLAGYNEIVILAVTIAFIVAGMALGAELGSRIEGRLSERRARRDASRKHTANLQHR